ncbi:hypothetical protein OH76DRAFT_1470383 [Lentinus brumalis]|uniref:Uncharacterized protein n=1 Tax=Lentinus brumalis TaxID=2498619 RepID=A0A371DIU7_9APHY|nr:hypothetical protein OH76DRAFT_1470383 [Polyporus brumalis]
MRLLDTCTGHFHEVENHFEVPYAILSHTWIPVGEQSFQDVRLLPNERSNAGAPANSRPSLLEDERLSAKIRSACRIAQEHGYRYLWLDSCCIDKTSSAELSEAINCMYSASHSQFRQSRWFKRGWTLQELIAPRDVIFLSSGWQVLGTKIGLDTVVEEETGINRAVLGHQELLHEVSVARRMSWAAARECTRVEDEAYSLMGIFDINMHTLYGEGRRAFVRLQKEILKRIPDQSLFAWGIPCLTALSLPPVLPPRYPESDNVDVSDTPLVLNPDALLAAWPGHVVNPSVEFISKPDAISLFAASPRDFRSSHPIRNIPHIALVERLGLSELAVPTYTSSSYGIHTSFCLLSASECLPRSTYDPWATPGQDWHFAILACEPAALQRHLIALVCSLERDPQTGSVLMKGGEMGSYFTSTNPKRYKIARVVALSPEQLHRWRERLRRKDVYMLPEQQPHLLSSASPARLTYLLGQPHPTRVPISLAGWTARVLRTMGFAVQYKPVPELQTATHQLILFKGRDCVVIEHENEQVLGTDGVHGQDPFVLATRVILKGYHRADNVRQSSPHAPESLQLYRLDISYICHLMPGKLWEVWEFHTLDGRQITIRVSLKATSLSQWYLDVEVP